MDFYEQVALTFIGEFIKTAFGQLTRLVRGPDEVRTLTRYDWRHHGRENPKVTGQFASIIRELEQQKAAIEQALEALKGIDGTGTPNATASEPIEKPATGRKGPYKRSAAARRKMAESQRLRWERVRAEADRVPF